jgi:hypothetical protein
VRRLAVRVFECRRLGLGIFFSAFSSQLSALSFQLSALKLFNC